MSTDYEFGNPEFENPDWDYEFGDSDWEDGFRAASDGESCLTSPFPKGTPEAVTWRRGFSVAHCEMGDISSLQERWIARLEALLPGTDMPVEDGLARFGIVVESEQVDELIRGLYHCGVTYSPEQGVWVLNEEL